MGARFERALDAAAVGVEFPPVIAAAYAARLDEAEKQRGAAMEAVLRDAVDAAVIAAIDQQVFAEDAHALLRMLCADLTGRA